MQIRNILLTTDFSDAAQLAYSHAATLARQFEARIWLAHVEDALPPFYYLTAEGLQLDVPNSPYLRDLEEKLGGETEHEALRSVDIETALLYEGHPIKALARFETAHDIDIAVLSTHGRTGLKHLFLGSFAERFIRHSRVPVLTTHTSRKGSGFAPRRVLVPCDFSRESRGVLPLVRFLAENFQSEFTFVHVIEPMPRFSDAAPEAFTTSVAESLKVAPDVASEEFEALCSDGLSGIEATLETRTGRPEAEILAAVQDLEPDLILLATHGWTGFEHFVLGSVAEKILRSVSCDVLTVKPQDSQSE